MTTLAIPCFASIGATPAPVAPLNINEAILNLIAEQPRQVADLVRMLGRTKAHISRRLRGLEVAHKVQPQRVMNPKGYYFLWHIGSGKKLPTLYVALPDPADFDLEEEDPSAGQPVRKFVQSWAPLKLRGELETYLFGPALEAA